VAISFAQDTGTSTKAPKKGGKKSGKKKTATTPTR
jgi:hypothetical protein